LRSNDCWWTGTSIRQIVIRAGGLGEQHKNNTASVIHARWTHLSGRSYAIVVRDQRSQHQNRRLALARLVALVAADEAEAQAARKGVVRHLHHQLHRGAPARIFEGDRFQPAQ
jgi:peptide chain release factor